MDLFNLSHSRYYNSPFVISSVERFEVLDNAVGPIINKRKGIFDILIILV